MTDKAISGLTEAFAVADNDFLVIETAGGNSRKVKRSNVSVAGRLTPTLIQKATLRGDGTIALGVAPTVGNLMVLCMGGNSATTIPANYKPAGFIASALYQSDANNAVLFAVRRVRSGDTGSYAMSAADNQAAVLYEFADASGVYGFAGGAMAGSFSGSSFSLDAAGSPYGVSDLVLGILTHDTTPLFSITGETGLTVDFLTPNDGQNHSAAFFHYDDTFDGTLAGSTSSAPTAPAFGLAAVVGAPG